VLSERKWTTRHTLIELKSNAPVAMSA
jgi:hypothetical protein